MRDQNSDRVIITGIQLSLWNWIMVCLGVAIGGFLAAVALGVIALLVIAVTPGLTL